MKNARRRINRKQREEGSALLVSLMIMVGLSLLGLGFVAVSETESAISVNERNSIEVLSRAEVGARTVVEWFQNPMWAQDQGLMPPNNGTYPNIVIDRDPGAAGGTDDFGIYKDPTSGGGRFCDRPYKDRVIDRFYGDERKSDFVINDTTGISTSSVNFLNNFNNLLFGNTEGGRISEIRIYAPPIIGGVVTAAAGETVAANGGFFVGGVRYGLCTIKVTAQKTRGTQVVAERSVKIVLSEWPFPGPQGPVQSNASIDTGGNFGVHWGRITAMGVLEDSRAVTSLPWHNAWDRIHFEHGFDTSVEWKVGLVTTANQTIVHPSTAAVVASTDGTTGEIVLDKFAYVVNTTTASMPAGEPAWATTANALVVGQTFTHNAIQYTTTYSREYPRTHAPNVVGVYRYTQSPTGALPANLREFNYQKELIGKSFEDPWFEARARSTINVPNAAPSPQLYPYSGPTNDEIADEKALFELQNKSDSDTHQYKQVSFPKIDYEFWKDIAMQAAATGQDGVKYLRWVDTDRYSDGLTTKKFSNWVNTRPPHNASAGFYFFDSRNGISPQKGNTTELTPEIKLNSSDLDGASAMKMEGFIYLNTILLNSTGIGGHLGYYNYPGEPFRDIGFRQVNSAGTGWALETGTNNYYFDQKRIGNSTWDYQDVNGNGQFDLYLYDRSFSNVDGGTTNTLDNYYVPRRWFPGCTVTDGAGSDATRCSEPHEPYVNLQYPVESTVVSGGGTPPALTVTWGNTTTAHVARAKEKMANGSLPNCGSNPEKCTSPKHDRDGGFIQLEPIMVGVFYNEGSYTGTGNATYYGSLLINGSVGKAGTADVYFDEKLIKGNWQEQFDDFPRVLITAHETDQQ